ncbi:hypothetical protein L1987_40906 [Smallanthus sonchifolius]|uniref:Uncharacterized protein n=1 Tax=Smallanthus sonchifolius TaxID=185202 RepID=A0ACB9GTN5_9ASTR|nr:hypothetical protein L1987_40906 [Smallanthus sonchifolius]
MDGVGFHGFTTRASKEKSDESKKFQFFKRLEETSYDHFENRSEEDELKLLLKYVKEKKLEVNDIGNIRHLRFVVKKHKAYQSQLSKGTFLIFVEEEEKERVAIISTFLKLGHKEEIIGKYSSKILRRMVARLKETREQKQQKQHQ